MDQPSDPIQQPTRTVSSDADSGCALDEFTWVPPGLTAQQVSEYMHLLPVHCVPYAGGSVGDRWRATQLLRQLPPQDTEVRYCHGLSDEEKRELRMFSAQRRHDSLGRATVLPVTVSNNCHQCDGAMHAGQLAVYASRAKAGTVWHPACFTCCVCMELLVDLVYFYGKDSQLYCGRHHAETMKPRCSACDEIIFSDECTEAEGNSWHTKHFVCCDCELPLGGQRYVMTDGRPFCCVCYERLYATECATCQQMIHVTDGHMVHGSRRWHATDSCFRCDSCACSLLGCPFVAIPGKDAIFCANCGIANKVTNSGLYTDKHDGVMGVNYLSPNSPMMKVQELSGKAFYNKSEGVDGKRYAGQSWDKESPMKAAAHSVSPRNSPLQCKPLPTELQSHTVCTNLASCCDDHRLSAEFQACASSSADHNKGVFLSESSTPNEKLFSRTSCCNNLDCDLRSAAQTTVSDDASNTTAAMLRPRPPLLGASEVDCLDNGVDINSGLEELIVEPLWSHSEPDGLAAGCTEVVGLQDDIGQKSRKSKNLNVRFDPSTKDPCSPVPHGVYCESWRPSSRRSLDDSDMPYTSYSSHCHAGGLYGSASVRIGRRRLGHGRHRGLNYIWPDAESRNHRANTNQASSRWTDAGDDYEHCSTCSSSSTDSDFDYSDPAFSSKAVPVRSQTLPQRRHNVASSTAVEFSHGVQRSKKHKKKHCTVS